MNWLKEFIIQQHDQFYVKRDMIYSLGNHHIVRHCLSNVTQWNINDIGKDDLLLGAEASEKGELGPLMYLLYSICQKAHMKSE